jgi:hypothetical protein
LGDSIGSIARLNDFTVTGSRINILADILTGMTQTYNGSTYIGNASFIGKEAKVGFLFESDYKSYFEYGATNTIPGSSIVYLDTNPIYVRTMISVDPIITFNGAVNDTIPDTHTLLLAAISDQSVPASAGAAAINNVASINFNDTVGADAPLYSLNSQVRVNVIQADSATAFVGQINVIDSVSTYSNQTYRANAMIAQASVQPGEVVFSVWDPEASITFNLAKQTAENSNCSGSSCGQTNLQNPGSQDTLRLNGDSNYINSQNTNAGAAGYWPNPAIVGNALGFQPPATASAASVPAPQNPIQLPPVTNLPQVRPDIPAPIIVTQPIRVELSLRGGADLSAALMQNSQTFAVNYAMSDTGSNSRVSVTMGDSNTLALSESERRNARDYQILASNQVVPAPQKGFVNVIFQLIINGEPIQLVSTSPQKAFELKLPSMALPRLDTLLQQQRQDGVSKAVTLIATLANGRPLPAWLKFNPDTQNFSASSIPDGAPDTQIKLVAMQDGVEIDQVVFTIDTP